jgi:hypothetical protein
MNPGSSVRPDSSMTSAPVGADAGLTASMRCPLTTMTAGDTIRPDSTST